MGLVGINLMPGNGKASFLGSELPLESCERSLARKRCGGVSLCKSYRRRRKCGAERRCDGSGP